MDLEDFEAEERARETDLSGHHEAQLVPPSSVADTANPAASQDVVEQVTESTFVVVLLPQHKLMERVWVNQTQAVMGMGIRIFLQSYLPFATISFMNICHGCPWSCRMRKA